MTLSGCVTSGRIGKPSYPELPADLRVCFDSAVAAPKVGVMTKSQVMNLIAKLKLSETEKIDCGKRIIAFHDSLSN